MIVRNRLGARQRRCQRAGRRRARARAHRGRAGHHPVGWRRPRHPHAEDPPARWTGDGGRPRARRPPAHGLRGPHDQPAGRAAPEARRIAEIEDVTVHVDPEDDSTAPPCIDLPLRPAAMARLHAAWSHLDCLARRGAWGCTTCRDESTWTFTCPSAATGARRCGGAPDALQTALARVPRVWPRRRLLRRVTQRGALRPFAAPLGCGGDGKPVPQQAGVLRRPW